MLIMCQECAITARKISSLLGCNRQITTRMEGVYSALGMPDLEHWVHCWTSQCKKYTGLLEQIQSRTTKMVKELEHLLYYQSSKEMGLFRLQIRRFRGISSMWINTQLEGMKKRQTIFTVLPTDRKRSNEHR